MVSKNVPKTLRIQMQFALNSQMSKRDIIYSFKIYESTKVKDWEYLTIKFYGLSITKND